MQVIGDRVKGKAGKFEIGPNDEWILCRLCGMRSYNPNDVAHRYCGHCHVFLEDKEERRLHDPRNGA